jgi:hypothetical protein
MLLDIWVGWSLTSVLVAVVVVAAAVVITVIGLKAMGVDVPQWAVQIFWVVVIVVVVILAIKLIASL